MRRQIQETATTDTTIIDFDKVLITQQGEWTIQSLGIELEEMTPFKKADSKKALRKVSHKVKK